jgi:signal transduction histidine kinase/HPt (histidine-containing phosphotransfer) domain-containing protein
MRAPAAAIQDKMGNKDKARARTMNTPQKPPQGPLPPYRAPGRELRGTSVLLALALMAVVGLSWIESGNYVGQQVAQAVAAAHDDAAHDARDIALGLRRNLTLLQGVPATFSRSQQVVQALQTGAAAAPMPQPLVPLNQYLERSVEDLNVVSVLWLIDAQGNCIASSNANKAESFVGTNYADRDYFKDARRGFSGKQFATGKKTGIPGLYFSAPVMQAEKVLGVVAAKVDLPFLALWLSQANAFVTDKYGVVILATDQRLAMHGFAQGVTPGLTEAQNMERYRLPRIPALPRRPVQSPGFTDVFRMEPLPTPMVHEERALADDGLVVHVLAAVPALDRMEQDRLNRCALESGFGLLVLLLVSSAVFYVRNIQRARAALLVHKSRLDEAQLLAQVGSWELDLPSGAMRWSDQVERIFRSGPSPTAPSLAAFLECIQHSDRPTLLKLLEDRSGATGRTECSVGIVRMDGDTGRARLQLQPVKDTNGRVEGYLGTLRDTTEQELLESELRRAKVEAESVSRLKTDFLATISHELKTPMNAILGMSYLALQGALSPSQKAHIQTVHRAAEQLLVIINEILDFSKIEAGSYALESGEFQLREVARNLSNAIAPLAQEKGLAFQLDLAPDVPTRLLGDPTQLGKVWRALASNAVKFTAQGRVACGVEVVSQTASAVALHFWVEDTGVGMTLDQQALLFKAFSQVDGSSTRKFGGTGLGLVISKRLVDMMGGTIRVQSTFGAGTTFHLTVPFGKVAEAPATASPSVTDAPVAVEAPLHATPAGTATPGADAAGAEPALPPLPGIDVAYGLAISMSDAQLYKSLLLLFGESERDFADKFHSAWQAGDRALAERQAHSLKGAAGSIGARDVQAAALALERACHQGLDEARIQPLLEPTLQALQVVLGGLAALPAPAASGATAVLDPAHLQALLTQLAQLLAAQDLSAYDVAEALAAASAGSAIAPQVSKVIKAIDRFDLDAAQDALKAVAATLEGL